jgi:hypothetical protein
VYPVLRLADNWPWNLILKDIKHVLSQLEHYNRSLEHIVPLATSMVQLLDSRRWMLEAANVSRLTLIALVFVPLELAHEECWEDWARLCQQVKLVGRALWDDILPASTSSARPGSLPHDHEPKSVRVGRAAC